MSSALALEKCWSLILPSTVLLGLSDRVSVPSLKASRSRRPTLQWSTLLSTGLPPKHRTAITCGVPIVCRP